ncbi:MAG: hypothetical protein J0L64_18365 [Acidobacteria bacterium]|nr:hypothetical protein [Acidobacteriota bacterium]
MWKPFALTALLSLPLFAQSAPQVLKVTGERHKLVLRSDGSVVGWGNISDGKLGPMAAIPNYRFWATGPVPIALPGKAIDVASHEFTSFALLDDHTVVAWGRNAAGAANSETPVRINGLAHVTHIATHGRALLALLQDGTVRTWGGADGGQPAFTPVPVPGVANVTQLSAGGGHVLALTADGRVLTWGSNYCGALGRPPRQETPMREGGEVPGLSGVVQVAAGNGVSTVLKKDGTVWVWGCNWHGQFGNGERTDPPGVNYGWELTPRPVAGVANVTAIAVGLTGRHTLALRKDGTLTGWGNTDWGQIGAGVSGRFQAKPVIPKIAGVKAVWAAGNNSFAVRADGSFWIWGIGERNEWPLQMNAKVPQRLDLP